MRLHGHASRGGPLPDRHRHGLRPARPRLDPPARARRRVGARRRPHVRVRVLRRVGAECARPAPAAHDDRPGERVVPVHDRAGRQRGAGAVPGRAGHVRRRARLGALLPFRVRRAALGRALGGGARARARRGRLQGDRLAPAREGLPRVGRGHHARGHAVRGRARLRGEAREGRLRRPGRARGRGRPRSGCSAASCSTILARLRSAPSRCGSEARSWAG